LGALSPEFKDKQGIKDRRNVPDEQDGNPYERHCELGTTLVFGDGKSNDDEKDPLETLLPKRAASVWLNVKYLQHRITFFTGLLKLN
jgi:hypothetical protein